MASLLSGVVSFRKVPKDSCNGLSFVSLYDFLAVSPLAVVAC